MFPLNRELISLLILFLIVLLISTLIPHLLGAHHGHIELALPNTSIIITPLALSPLVFIPLVYLVYLIKEWHHRYGRNRQRRTLIIFNSLLVMSLASALFLSNILNLMLRAISTSNPGLEVPSIVAILTQHFPRMLFIVLLGLSLLTMISVSILPFRKR